MKKYLFNMALASMVCMLGSCNNGEKDPVTNDASEYITISTNILTRVAVAENGSQEFENGDKISVYAWTGSKASVPDISQRVVDNAINTLAGGTWQAVPQMLWKNMSDEHFFIGVYPSNAQSIANLEESDFEVNANLEESDLLVATNLNGIKAQANPVSLTFDHLLAKIIVNLEFRNQWGADGPEVASVTLDDVATKCKVNYLQKTVVAGTERGTFALAEVKANQSYASIVVPQSGIKTIKVNINGRDYVYQHDTDIDFEGGKYTIINLTVGRNELSLGSIVINDWLKGDEISGGEALD